MASTQHQEASHQLGGVASWHLACPGRSLSPSVLGLSHGRHIKPPYDSPRQTPDGSTNSWHMPSGTAAEYNEGALVDISLAPSMHGQLGVPCAAKVGAGSIVQSIVPGVSRAKSSRWCGTTSERSRNQDRAHSSTFRISSDGPEPRLAAIVVSPFY